MGQDWRPNRALSNDLIHRILSLTESRILSLACKTDREEWVSAGARFYFCYVLSLRSPEGLMVDRPGMIEFGDRRLDYVVIPLLRQVKGRIIQGSICYIVSTQRSLAFRYARG